MKSSTITILFSLFLFVLVSCEKSPEADPAPLDDVAEEVSTDSYLAFYNSVIDMANVKIEINSSSETVDLSKTILSEYFHLKEGQQRIVITNAESGEPLLTKNISLEGGEFYSTYLYINEKNEFDLLVNKDYDESFRAQGNLTNALDIVVVNLASNIPFEHLDIVNSHTYMTANCGAGAEHCTIKHYDLRNQWVNKLAFGNSQSVPHAAFSRATNHLQFVSSSAGDVQVGVAGLNAKSISLTIDPNGSGNLQTIERFDNVPNLDPKVRYLLILEDIEEQDNGDVVHGKFLELSSNPISQVSFF